MYRISCDTAKSIGLCLLKRATVQAPMHKDTHIDMSDTKLLSEPCLKGVYKQL